jgi:hypothetical protein
MSGRMSNCSVGPSSSTTSNDRLTCGFGSLKAFIANATRRLNGVLNERWPPTSLLETDGDLIFLGECRGFGAVGEQLVDVVVVCTEDSETEPVAGRDIGFVELYFDAGRCPAAVATG